jgi:hypothetical protein
MSRIHLTIDRIVFSGANAMDHAAREAFIRNLRAELAQRLAAPATRAAWARSHRTPVLRLGQLPLQPGISGAGHLGTQVARNIGRGLKP